MKSLCRKLFLLLGSLAVALLLAEIGVRLFVEPESKRLAIYDSELGWRGRPDGSGVYIRHDEDIRVPYSYNNYGFRDGDITERTSHAPRIVMLGDSFLECLEMEHEDVHHELLEGKLRQTTHDHSAVMALGAQGYSSSQQLLAFRKFKDILDADVVLTLFFTGNDFEDNQRKHFAYLDSRGNLLFPKNNASWTRVLFMRFRRWIYESSHLVFLVKNTVEARMSVNLAAGTKTTVSENDDYKNEITRQLLLQTNTEVEDAGARYGIIVIPSKEELAENNRDKIDLVMGWCDEHNIPALDLSQTLTLDHYFELDLHFNKVGHKVVAEQTHAFLLESFQPELKQDKLAGNATQ